MHISWEFAAALFVAIFLVAIPWVGGVGRLFDKGHRTLGRIALVGLVVPFVGLVGYAGWFIKPRAAKA